MPPMTAGYRSGTALEGNRAMTREELEAQAMQLPSPERSLLVKALIASLDEEAEEDGEEVERAWIEEVRRRVAQVQSGEVTTIPAEEVFRKLRERFGF